MANSFAHEQRQAQRALQAGLNVVSIAASFPLRVAIIVDVQRPFENRRAIAKRPASVHVDL
jgi:hypothetical protein